MLRVWLLLAMTCLTILAPGCASDPADSKTEETEEALENCAAYGTNVYLELDPKSERASRTLYTDASRRQSVGMIAADSIALRQEAQDVGGVVMRKVQIRRGTLVGKSGWVDARALRVRTPRQGECTSGRDPFRNVSASERWASVDSLPLAVLSNIVFCAAGLTEAAVDTTADLWTGLLALAKGSVVFAKEVIRRDIDIILYLLGSDEAAARLSDASARDREKVLALMALSAQAIPMLHQYLMGQYLYYEGLSAEYKSKYLCKLIGRVSLEVLLTLGTSGMSLTRAPKVLTKLERIHAATAQVAEIPGRVHASSIVVVSEKYLTPLHKEFVETGQEMWRKLVSTSDLTERKRLMRKLSERTNPAGEMRWTGTGNCASATRTNLFLLASGNLACALPYFGPGPGPDDTVRELTLAKAFKTRSGLVHGVEDVRTFADLHLPNEGQMAILVCGMQNGAHEVVVVRMGRELFVVNNQGWDQAAELAGHLEPGGHLQKLAQWDATWRSRSQGPVGYELIVTDQAIPFAQ